MLSGKEKSCFYGPFVSNNLCLTLTWPHQLPSFHPTDQSFMAAVTPIEVVTTPRSLMWLTLFSISWWLTLGSRAAAASRGPGSLCGSIKVLLEKVMLQEVLYAEVMSAYPEEISSLLTPALNVPAGIIDLWNFPSGQLEFETYNVGNRKQRFHCPSHSEEEQLPALEILPQLWGAEIRCAEFSLTL